MLNRSDSILILSAVTLLLVEGAAWPLEGAARFNEDFTGPMVEMEGDQKVWKVAQGELVGQAGAEWNYSLIKQQIPADSVIEVDVTISQNGPAGAPGQGTGDWFRYRAQRDCPGSEACLILRSFGSSLTESWWYRVELSARYGEIALHKGNGGYVQVVPAEVKAGTKHRLKAEARQNRIRAWLDGRLLIDFQDDFAPIEGEGGRWGVGVFGTQVRFDNLTVTAPEETTLTVLPQPRRYMRLRPWREGQWIFCDNEPIAWLDPEGKHTGWPGLAEMKLLPGYQPMLMAKLTWGHCMPNNEFADKVEIVKAEGEEVVVRTTGHTLFVKSTGVQLMTVSYDRVRKCFSYHFDSRATVAADTPRRAPVEYNVLFPYSSSPNAWGQFHFDPLTEGVPPGPPLPPTIARTDGGWYLDWQLFPGPGFTYRLPIRVDWDSSPEPRATRVERYVQFQPRPGDIYARGLHPVINPAVEWLGPEQPTGQASFAVCCFSHETHLSDCPVKWDTEEERSMHRVYRLIGLYPAEMVRMFRASRLPAIPEMYRVKVLHRPGVNDFGPGQLNAVSSPQVGNTWKGFYDVDLACGKGDNSSLLLQPIPKPAAYGGGVQMPYATARLLKPTGNWDDWGYVPAPKYLVIADVKTEGLTGKGVYFTLEREGKKVTHYPRLTGTNDWTTAGFVTDLFAQPGGNQAYVTVGLEGEGKAWIDNLEVRPLKEGEQPPAGVSPEPQEAG